MTNFILGEGEEEYVEGIRSMYIVVSFVIYTFLDWTWNTAWSLCM